MHTVVPKYKFFCFEEILSIILSSAPFLAAPTSCSKSDFPSNVAPVSWTKTPHGPFPGLEGPSKNSRNLDKNNTPNKINFNHAKIDENPYINYSFKKMSTARFRKYVSLYPEREIKADMTKN